MDMENIAKSLPNPKSYFVGISGADLIMAENILILGRHSKRLPSAKDRVHHRFLLAFNQEGPGYVIVDGARHSFFPKQCFLIFPHQHHHFFYETHNMKWIFITFELKRNDFLENLRDSTLEFSDEIGCFLEMLISSYDGTRPLDFNEATKVALLTNLLLNELQKSKKIRENCRFNFVDKINRYIYANLNRPLFISELATEFACSSSHLCARYRKEMGISLGKYIKEMKLHKGQSYLGNTDMSVGEIAEACGYDSLYSFSHAFKNYSGVSPLEFRQAMKRKVSSKPNGLGAESA